MPQMIQQAAPSEGSKMEATPTQIEALKTLMREMSAADLSILEAMAQTLQQEETVRLATTPGSKNDVLWSQMAVLNWMRQDEPLAEHPGAKVYVVSREARERIEALLLDLKRDELPKLLSEFCRDIPPLIGPRVIAAGGTPADLVMMLAGIVQSTMRGFIREDLHEQFLQAVYDRARDLNQVKQR
jgi:hypothetical protein